MLPPILRAYRERFPSVEILLRWFPVVEQAEALRRGDADISFMRPVPDLEEVTWETILEEPFVLAVPARHPFAERRVNLAEGLRAGALHHVHARGGAGLPRHEHAHVRVGGFRAEGRV
ncbi:LysR substrate-binding domain-containing protein (plasmid) [Cupriavidus basilensis]